MENSSPGPAFSITSYASASLSTARDPLACLRTPLRPGSSQAAKIPGAGSAQATRTAIVGGYRPVLARARAPRASAQPQRPARPARPRSRRRPSCPSSPPARPSGPPAASTSPAAGPAERPPARSPRRTCAAPCSTSARPRTTSTLRQLQRGHDLLEERGPAQQRLDQGHRAGPGARSPAPGRAGRRPSRCRTTVASSGISSPSSAQFTRCRSQSRGASRGPIRPRTTPSVGEQLGVPLGQRQPVRRKRPPRHLGRGGRFT